MKILNIILKIVRLIILIPFILLLIPFTICLSLIVWDTIFIEDMCKKEVFWPR
jgi:hypothetical protein